MPEQQGQNVLSEILVCMGQNKGIALGVPTDVGLIFFIVQQMEQFGDKRRSGPGLCGGVSCREILMSDFPSCRIKSNEPGERGLR